MQDKKARSGLAGLTRVAGFGNLLLRSSLANGSAMLI
jgi:hypothetical protein